MIARVPIPCQRFSVRTPRCHEVFTKTAVSGWPHQHDLALRRVREPASRRPPTRGMSARDARPRRKVRTRRPIMARNPEVVRSRSQCAASTVLVSPGSDRLFLSNSAITRHFARHSCPDVRSACRLTSILQSQIVQPRGILPDRRTFHAISAW